MIMNKKLSDEVAASSPTMDQLSLCDDEEGHVPVEIKNKNLAYWLTRAYLLFDQARRSCQPEKKKKRRASYESVFGSDFEGDLDGEDSYIRIKPEPIDTYLQMTKFTRVELQMMYRGFKQECPNGIVREETFKAIYAHFFPRTSETDLYASLVYNSIDRSGPVVTFTELVLTLSALARGSLQDKLRWAFSLYDVDHDGILSRADLYRVIMSVYCLLGRSNADMYELMAQDHADRVFAMLDINGDGVITIQEFMDSCLQNSRVTESLLHFDTIL